MSEQITLTHLKKNPGKIGRFNGKKVFIYSGEHQSWWRPKGCGYTLADDDDRGVYMFEDAFRRTRHCCPRKKIKFQVLRDQAVEVTQ